MLSPNLPKLPAAIEDPLPKDLEKGKRVYKSWSKILAMNLRLSPGLWLTFAREGPGRCPDPPRLCCAPDKLMFLPGAISLATAFG